MWPDVHESIMTIRVSHEGPSWPSIQAPALLDTKHPGDQQHQVEYANFIDVRSAVMASSQLSQAHVAVLELQLRGAARG